MSGYAIPEALASTAWVAEHLDDPRVRLIECVNSVHTLEPGRIAGAVRWCALGDLETLDFRLKAEPHYAASLFARSGIAPETTVVIYGASFSACALAFWYLKLFGHADVRLMDGGRRKWLAERRPLVAEEPRIAPAEYPAPEPDPRLRALRADVERAVNRAGCALVDTRRDEEYRGEWFGSKPPVEGERAGHIPGAAHVHYEDTYHADGTFKAADELRAMYERRGVTPDKEVITYCAAGWRAAHGWFVLTYLLGYPAVRNYDASWQEWGRLPDTPIER